MRIVCGMRMERGLDDGLEMGDGTNGTHCLCVIVCMIVCVIAGLGVVSPCTQCIVMVSMQVYDARVAVHDCNGRMNYS